MKKRFALLLTLICVGTTPALAEGYDVSGAPCVALTFDDGPDAKLTPQLLAILEEEKVPATFYVVGRRVARWPDIVKQEAADGDEIGNHSWSHPTYASVHQYAKADAAIEKALDSTTPPATLRAPYGLVSRKVERAEAPRPFIAWTVDTLDWRYHNPARIARVASEESGPGAIVLMHDIHPKTIQAVPGVITGLRERGFVFKTVSGLSECTY